MLHKYNGPVRGTYDEITGVWTKCGKRVEPWEARHRWADADCDACRAHPDYRIAVAKKRKG